MKIICVGYWKTGTKSMTKALTTLGYNVYDFEEQIMYLKHLWDKFFDGTVTDQDIYEAFKDVDVIIDGPTVAFWSEIYKVFPEAKIIFTVRDEDSWWRSFKNMQDKFFEKSQLKFALLLTPTGYSLLQFANKIFGFLQGIETFSVIKMNWCANERLYKMKYRMHNAFVHQTIGSFES
ncbi:uncharacterized protein LOC143446861 isoform X2 [Clavelina lepadiformis]|uniref:uncharacterized protein LOC143446861 isoform X2 n=1 Tax=Clavelina lepadiformis TaxID=159417 RepID=UPI004041D20E